MFEPTFEPFTLHWYAGRAPPFAGTAVKVTEVPWQTGLEEAEMVTEAGRFAAATMVIAFEVTGFIPVIQLLTEVILQVMMSPFAGLQVKPGLFVPAGFPLMNHWYPGAGPPLDGLAVKLTELTVQNGLVSVEIKTAAGSALLTIITTGREVTGLLLTQVAFEVNLHVTTSPFKGI